MFSYIGHINLFNLLCSLFIFLIFWFIILKKIVIKHTVRIKGYKDSKKYFWNFFDIPSFIIMAFMITIGIFIRTLNLFPDVLIAIFYSGLGLALFGAGIMFLKNYFYYSNWFFMLRYVYLSIEGLFNLFCDVIILSIIMIIKIFWNMRIWYNLWKRGKRNW